MATDPNRILAYAERLAAVAHHTFESDASEAATSLADDFVTALDQLMKDGLTLDEAYQDIFARLSDGVADG